METRAQLQALISSLAGSPGVFGLTAEADSGTVEELVLQLAMVAHEARAHYAVQGSDDPTTADDIAAALEPVTAAQAVEIMMYLSADDLVFPGHKRRDQAHAQRAAERVTQLVGHPSKWWTNIELGEGVRGWTPVTLFTFDGVIVGVGEEHAVVLLQVGED